MGLQSTDPPPSGRARVRSKGHSSSASVDEICSWASQLAAESRDRDALLKSYVWPKSLIEISELLDGMRGGLVVPELHKLPSLWTHSYFVSTAGHVSAKTIQEYIKRQSKK
jgi:REP element-mobilizing transposase RayT